MLARIGEAFTDYHPIISAILMGAIGIIVLANLPPWIRALMGKSRIIGGRFYSRHGSCVWSSQPLDIHGAEFGAAKTALHIENGAGSRINDSVAHGLADHSVGYELVNSPRSNLDRSISRNNETGFRIVDSEGTSLQDTKAERESAASRKLYTVKLPEGMKRKD